MSNNNVRMRSSASRIGARKSHAELDEKALKTRKGIGALSSRFDLVSRFGCLLIALLLCVNVLSPVIALPLAKDGYIDLAFYRPDRIPMKDVKVEVKLPPWFKVNEVFSVNCEGFTNLKYRNGSGKAVLLLDQLEAGKLIVLSQKKELSKRLLLQWKGREEKRREAFAELQKMKKEEKVKITEVKEVVLAKGKDYMIVGEGINTYGIKREKLWNPTEEKYNCLEWYREAATQDARKFGVKWIVSIPPDKAGEEYTIFLNIRFSGIDAHLVVLDSSGKTVLSEIIDQTKYRVYSVPLKFSQAGNYTIELFLEGLGYKFGQVAKVAYVIPTKILSEE